MNCPTCNKVIPKVGWCTHTMGKYKVRYDHDIDYGIKTIVWKSSDDELWVRFDSHGYKPCLTLPGIIKLDVERIEKLLVLK